MADGKLKSIVGYPIVYNKDSENMGFIERVAPGAAKKALKTSDIRGLKNHNPDLIFARTGKNLKLFEDEKGVRYEATPINTRNFREIAEEIDAGLLTGQSFSFTITADEWKDLKSDTPRRTITEFGEIFDVGPVTYPAYPDTSVALRSLEMARSELPPSDSDNDDGDKITLLSITDGGTEFVFNGFEQFERVAKQVEEIRKEKHGVEEPKLDDPPGNPNEPKLDEGFPPEMDGLEERMSVINDRIYKMGIEAQKKEIEQL